MRTVFHRMKSDTGGKVRGTSELILNGVHKCWTGIYNTRRGMPGQYGHYSLHCIADLNPSNICQGYCVPVVGFLLVSFIK